MSGQASTETAREQELYRIVKQLSAAMVLELKLAISAPEKEATCKIGESCLRTITKNNMVKAKRKLMAHHIERTIEAFF